eukprot:5042751-Alexandrium_andersonii.AAC.1
MLGVCACVPASAGSKAPTSAGSKAPTSLVPKLRLPRFPRFRLPPLPRVARSCVERNASVNFGRLWVSSRAK